MLLFDYYPFFKIDKNGQIQDNDFWDVGKIVSGKFSYRKLRRSTAVNELLESLLNPDPKYRLSAKDALNHRWFKEPVSAIKLMKNKKKDAEIIKFTNFTIIDQEIEKAQEYLTDLDKIKNVAE